MRAGRPIWLAGPTRFAGLDRVRARIGLALFALLLAACLTAIGTPGPQSSGPADTPGAQTDLLLYQSIVEGVRQGDTYYAVAAQAQRLGHYPLKPFFTMRLPTLAVVEAALPPAVVPSLLMLLCLATVIVWVLRLRRVLTGPVPAAVAGALVLGGLYVHLDASLVVFHELWAGPLIALSLALRRRGEWLSAVALGLCAMLIRETALLYVAIMAAAAAYTGERREALGWLSSVALFAVVLAAHAHAVALVSGPLDLASQGWSGLQGFGFYVKLATISCGLDLVPQWLASLLLGTSLLGWVAWRDPTGARGTMMLGGYAALISFCARPDNFYWALITTPVLLLGLVFAIDGLRDLVGASLGTRRITVTRVVR